MKDSIDSLDFSHLAPAGYYIALRIGFAFPMEEVNALPPAWVAEYTRDGLMLHDPVMRWVYANDGSSRWSEFTIDDPRGVLGRAAEHGLCFGVAISHSDEDCDGQRSFGSFARNDREFKVEEIRLLETRLSALHASRLPPANLTQAELEALRMVKNGLLMKQIANELGVTEGAVKQRLKNAKLKLKAKTSTQAATLATGYGLI
ncbi:autoinducer binding domain-containing protein [Ostreiculturibacter nitratireducens]|uniref:autoinducer binding domain-containing protein n=1 Tax=Ostreiculturibacter nitratireducens TaxID=3075226 RepID=UPI0031B5E604